MVVAYTFIKKFKLLKILESDLDADENKYIYKNKEK